MAITSKRRGLLAALLFPQPVPLVVTVRRISFDQPKPTATTVDDKKEAKRAYWRDRYKRIDGPRRRAARKVKKAAKR